MAATIRLLSFLFCLFGLTASSHFRGGTIQWRPVNAAQFDGRIEATHRIAWRRSSGSGGSCTQSTIDNRILIGGGTLNCRIGCSGSIGSLAYYCTDFSTTEDWSAGERTQIYDTSGVTYFEASYASCCWITLYNGQDPSWEIRVKGNLTRRADNGLINTSPISTMPPVVRLQRYCNHTIEIPVSDADGDIVRCRWAEGSECAGVCSTFPGATLNECTLRYAATGSIGWYAVALQIEDFTSPSDTIPLSSVPLQFLVLVFSSNAPCASRPEFVEPTRVDRSCIGVPFNTTWHEPLIAQSGAEGVSITEVITASPPGLRRTALTATNNSRQWYLNATWAPTDSQYGPNLFCYSCSDSIGLNSVQSCITLLGGVEAPLWIGDSISPTGEIFPNHTDWSIRFDKQILRSTRSRYIKIYEEGGRQVIRINAATSSSVIFPQGNLRWELTFRTLNFLFTEKRRYYVLLDPGVAVGPEFCGPESPAIRDPRFWVVSIADITPPTLTFSARPYYSNENITISWSYDEEVSSHCTLQTPTRLLTIPCNQTAMLHGLEEGLHSLYIQGIDLAGNTATVRHTWTVDLTPPLVRISSFPPVVSSRTSWTFRFYCVNEWMCTYMCSLHTSGSSASYTPCSGMRFTGSLQNGGYSFAVFATDGVGNIGNPVNFQWTVDTVPPTISMVSDVSLTCGSDYSPSAVAIPTVTDNEDLNPSLTHQDLPSAQCSVQRVWTATDDAGNTATMTQTITFTVPQPPRITAPSRIDVPCGSVEDAIRNAAQTGLLVVHPCGRPITVTFNDSTRVDRCGFTFTRTWRVQDDCGSVSTFTQNIRVLSLQLPGGPENGQVNTRLDEPLLWPQFPGAYSYEVYVWQYGTQRPNEPTAVTSTRIYRPPSNYAPGTRYLWQIEYVTGVNTTVPSPIWGFETQSFPDLTVTTITVPPYAFSGQDFQLSWTVNNIGNLSSGVSIFNDAVNMGPTTDFSESRRVVTIRQSRFVDPQDGYISSATVNLNNNDIGNFYLFVETDIYGQVNDIDRRNNRRTSISPVRVMLTPPPNLVVETVIVPSSTFSGQAIFIRWTISNDGVGVTESNRWYDRVFWSSDELLDGRDLLLGSYVFDGILAAGATYTKTVTVSIPNAIYGNFTVIVVTDAFNNVYEHTTENDNIGISRPLDVILSPPPDLIVSSLEAGAIYATGDTMRVVFTVMNAGAGEPFETYWNDELVLTVIPSGREYILSRSTHYGTLQSADSYSSEVRYPISPSLQTGRYNLTAYTDYSNVVFEFNSEGNNLRWKEILIVERLPDLVVFAATFSVQRDAQGNSIQVNYTVSNQGMGQSLGAPWTDKIGLSTSQIYSIRSTRFIAEFVQRSELLRDESISATLTARVPRDIHGRLFLHVVTDFNQRIVEESETNNIRTTGPLMLLPVFPDLSVQSLLIPSGPDTVSGEEILVNWTVANEGSGALQSGSWIDAVYIDTTSQISPLAVKLADVAVSASLQPQRAYHQSTTVLIPQNFAGTYYLILSVNNLRAIDENGIVGNNVASYQLSLSTPPSPDLTVTTVSYAMTDRVLTLYWTISNTGNTMRRTQSWTDQVFLLGQSTFDRRNAIRLGHQSVTGLRLESYQEYRASGSFVLPVTTSGNYYVFVETDSANRVLEVNGEDNNIGRAEDPVLIERLPTPMLSIQVVSTNLPASLLAGQTVTFEYVISNIGEALLSTSSWTDEIYLYPGSNAYRDTVLRDGVFLTQVVNNRELEVGESVTISVNVTIPYGINQLMYFVVILDVNENLGDPTQIGNQGNLITAGNNRVFVEQGPLSDLHVIPPSTNITLRGGQPAMVTYEVANMGENSAVGTWYEAVYLSRDAILDPFDTRLRSVKNQDNIRINGSYIQTAEVFIPFDLPSSRYYFFFQVDDGNRIIELDENNNVGQQIVSIQEAVSTDISVVRVSASPTNLDYGNDVNFQWDIRNNGSLAAEGYKCDTVYLSEDDKWDITDNQLGDAQCNTINIPPYEGNSVNDRSFMLTEPTPFIAQQDYTGIVRTRSNIRDPNLENNIGSTVMPLSVNAPTLLLDTSTAIDLETGDEAVYKIEDIPGERTLVATLSVNGIVAYHDLFLRYRKPPTGYDYDAFSQKALSSNQTAVVRNTRTGTYYLRIESSGREIQSYQVQVLVKIARFEILDISPRTAAPLGSVTIFFSGTVFGYFVGASIISTTNPTDVYNASNVYWFNSEEVYATFDASALPAGMYTAKLTDTTTGAVAQLNNSLEIAPGIPGQLSVLVRPPRPLRAGASGRISLYIRNTGNTDILTPLMTLQTGGNALVRLLDENALTDYATEINFLPLPTSGPGGILPPGASTQAYFDVMPKGARVQRDTVQFTHVEDTQSTEPHAYLEQRSDLRPPGFPDHVWDIVWQNFLDSVGETWGSLHNRISEIATEFSLVQKRVFSWDDIVSYQLQVADGFLTGNTLLVIEDIAEEGSDTILPLAVRRQYSSYIHKRRTAGPMGMGWILPWWEMRIQSFSSREAEVWNGRDLVTFTTSDPGVYIIPNDDTKVLTVNSGGVRYEDTQSGVVYTFNRSSGELTGIDNLVDNSSIVVEHRGQDYPVLFTHSNGKSLNITYTDSGLISYADLLDADNNVETTSLYSYDVSSQFLTMVTVGRESATYTYSDDGDLLSIVYASGERRTLQYDENNLLSASESYSENDDLIASMKLTNSWNGKVVMTIQPYNRTVQMVYDTFGEVISATTEDGIPLTQVDLPGSNGQRIIEGDEVISQEYRDEETNTLYQTSADGNQIAYRFDETGNLMSYTDSEGNAYSAVYDIDGKITEFQNPDETKTMLNYDNKGLISSVVNPDGSEIMYSYDSDDTMIQKDTGSERISYEYDSKRRLTRGTNREGTMQIVYNDNGAPVQVLYPSGRILTYGYNNANQREYIADSSGYNVTYNYNGQSRLSEIRRGSNGELVAAFEYGNEGGVIQKTLGNGAYTTYHYLGGTQHLSELRNYLPNGSLSSKFLYEYDRKGKITSMTSVSGNWTYTYDATGQLIKWTSPNGDVTELAYDSRGNRIVQTKNAQQAGYTTNNMNQYTVFNETDTFTYDPNGNLRQKNTRGRTENFVFNSEGKLTETETPEKRCSYHYDALGNLYRKNCSDFTAFWYLVDPFGQFGADIIAEISDTGTTYFVNSFEQGLMAAMNGYNGSMLYYEFDGDGSVLSVMNNQGAIQNSYQYDPFGKVLWQSEQIRNIFQFVGRFGVIRDLELANMFMMRARHYDAEHGRFISLDPIGVAGKSTNFYVYAYNSPMLIKDPTGRILPVILLGKVALGAVGSVAVYYATAAITGSETSLGGALGAAASGAIGGPAAGLGQSVLKEIAKKVVLPALGAFTGTLVENVVEGEPLNYWEAAQGALFNVIAGNLPTKYLGHKLNKYIPKRARQFLNKYKNLAWYNSIKPLLKKLLDTRSGKFLMKLAKDTFTSLWESVVQPRWNALFEWIVSVDPNDILGPAGFGDAHFIPPDQTLDYRIRFENDPNATAPAQRVFIRHQLDEDLDVRTFRIGDFGFGDFTQEVTLSRPILQELVDVTASLGVFVRVRAGINVVTKEATWELQALDPETGEAPVDPSIGFLPPNNGTDGQGYVTFSVRAREQVSSLFRIDATASIIFDQNEPIDTPPIFNTIDSSNPTLNLTVIPDLLYNGTLALQLHKFDTGSGVDEVDIFQLTRANDSALQQVQPLVLGTKGDVAVLALSPGSQYQIFASAVDNVGNRRSLEEDMQNFVTIDFPNVERNCPNNCSERGICTEFSTCQCSPGYYASDCSQDTPPVEPPILTISSRGGAEDIPVPIRLSAMDAASTSATGVVVKVMTFPTGSTFSRGTFDGNIWTFNSADFGDVELTLPQHLSGEILLRATAAKAGATREGAVRIPIQAVADPPNLSVGDVCYDSAVSSINLPIQSSLVDNDGSETLLVVIAGIPENATLSVGQRNGSNEYTLSAQDLANVQVQFTGSFQPVNVNITALSRELMSGDTAYTSASVSIELCTQSGIECEDGYIADVDGENCIDVDECTGDTHLCDQVCTNTLGSYTCSCNQGYLLHYNGTSCHAVLHYFTIIIIAIIPGAIVALLVLFLLVCCCCCCYYCRLGKYKSGIAGMGISNRNFEGIAGMGVVNPTSEAIVVNPVFEEDRVRYDVKTAF